MNTTFTLDTALILAVLSFAFNAGILWLGNKTNGKNSNKISIKLDKVDDKVTNVQMEQIKINSANEIFKNSINTLSGKINDMNSKVDKIEHDVVGTRANSLLITERIKYIEKDVERNESSIIELQKQAI